MVDFKSCHVSLDSVTVEVDGRIILDGVSFDVGGGLIAIIGPNGAGKTTLLRVIAGILKPTRGSVKVCGLDPRGARRFISYVPAFLHVDPYARVEDVLRAYLYDTHARFDLEMILESMGLRGFMGRRFNSLSGGEHKLVLIAGALARSPRLLLLDEPFSHLDLANQVKLAKLLSSIGRSVTVIMTVHEPLHAIIADKVGLLSSGRLVAFGEPGEVLRKSVLEDVYGVELEEVNVESRKILLPSLRF